MSVLFISLDSCKWIFLYTRSLAEINVSGLSSPEWIKCTVHLKGQRDDSVSDKACHHICRLAFDLWNLWGGRKEPTSLEAVSWLQYTRRPAIHVHTGIHMSECRDVHQIMWKVHKVHLAGCGHSSVAERFLSFWKSRFNPQHQNWGLGREAKYLSVVSDVLTRTEIKIFFSKYQVCTSQNTIK